MLIAETV